MNDGGAAAATAAERKKLHAAVVEVSMQISNFFHMFQIIFYVLQFFFCLQNCFFAFLKFIFAFSKFFCWRPKIDKKQKWSFGTL